MDQNRTKGVLNMNKAGKQEPNIAASIRQNSDLPKFTGFKNISLSNDQIANDKQRLDPTIVKKQENS